MSRALAKASSTAAPPQGGLASCDESSMALAEIWKFSNLFSTINNWQLSDIPSMAVHLKTCPFYDVEYKKDPVLLTYMLPPEEEVEETLVSTLRHGHGPKKVQRKLL
ncbi:hypothetical protein JD844_009964 [Phrynosoma platyrhinos]|uniref:F-box domain-containing protein n=1 Tax=Phrynosoma platyrhinos TaxID=52577 RepID=A0ABQ7TG44_PHRPL|nr:hypothetical protein JD844_009964 [Phrynosoma platyrhinos]